MDAVVLADDLRNFEFGDRLPIAAKHYGGLLRWHPPCNIHNGSPTVSFMGRSWQPMFTIQQSPAADASQLISVYELDRPRVCALFIQFEPQKPVVAEIISLCLAAHCQSVQSKLSILVFKSLECQSSNTSPSMYFLRTISRHSGLFAKSIIFFPAKDQTIYRVARLINYIGARLSLNIQLCSSMEELDEWYAAANFSDYRPLLLSAPYMSEFVRTANRLTAQYPEDAWDLAPLIDTVERCACAATMSGKWPFPSFRAAVPGSNGFSEWSCVDPSTLSVIPEDNECTNMDQFVDGKTNRERSVMSERDM